MRLVLGPDVDEVERVRGRRHVGEVELRTFETASRIAPSSPVSRSTSSREVEPREPRDVEHLLSVIAIRPILPEAKTAGPRGARRELDRP